MMMTEEAKRRNSKQQYSIHSLSKYISNQYLKYFQGKKKEEKIHDTVAF